MATLWFDKFFDLQSFLMMVVLLLLLYENVRWSNKNIFLWKSAIYNSIKLPFDVEVAEIFLNSI